MIGQDAREAPKGWIHVSLGELLPLAYGKALIKSSRNNMGCVTVYGSSGVIGSHSTPLVTTPTLIIGRKGTIGAVYISAEPCWVIDTAYFVEQPSSLNLSFFKYYLESLRLSSLDRSTAVPGLSRDDYNRVEIAVPPEAEQHRIVAEIEKQFTRLDAGVDALKRVQANLKRYREAVLKAACEGRLVPTEAEVARREGRSYEPADELLKYAWSQDPSAWQFDSPDTLRLRTLPEGWTWTCIGRVAECLDRRRVPINKQERNTRGGCIPYYGANGQVGFIDDHLFDEPLVLVVEDETFVGRRTAFSYIIRGKSWVNNHVHVLRPSGAVLADYLNYSLAFYPFTPLTTGSTGRRKLTQKALMSAPYALPPLAEQVRIVREVERLVSKIDYTAKAIEEVFPHSGTLRQAILKVAFDGKLVPQDPRDEPAIVLLERIRAERAAVPTVTRKPPVKARRRVKEYAS